ncbi:MAG: hypothetical protein LBC68_07730 [Prevotellaceae bacterium]|jgi:hypothetical protein|nr:hypothetical protein [Prevotellaceae bacterium]
MSNNTLTYTINLNGNITNGVLNISTAAAKATGSMEKLTKTAKTIANIGFAVQHVTALVGKFTAAMDKCVQAYNVQAVAEKKLETLMRNNISATDAQIQSIKDLTAAQQKLGVIGDEIQLSGAQELSTYLTKTESLKKLIPAMNDMLAQQYGLNATQEQAVTIAQMMGKVLDGQVGALSRYGYRFDEAQEKVLKFGNEEQKVAMLSGILQQYVGGVNAALAATPEGKWKQHQNEVGDLRERIGKLFVDIRGAMMPLFEAVSSLVERITGFFEKNAETISRIAGIVTDSLIVGLNIVAGTLGVIWDVVSGLFTTMADYLPVILGAAAVYLGYWIAINRQFLLFSVKYYAYHTWIKISTVLTKLWAAATKSVFGILGLVIGAVTVAISLFKLFKKGQDEATKAVNSVAAKIGVETSNLNKLFEAMKKTEPASERRKNLIDEINAKYPGLLKNQDLYRASIDAITTAQKEANKALASNMFLQNYKETEAAAVNTINKAKQDFWEAAGSNFSDTTIRAVIEKIEKTAAGVIASGYESIDARQHLKWEKSWYKSSGDTEAYNLIDELDSNWTGIWGGAYKSLLNTIFDEQLKLKKLKDFGSGYLGVSTELMNAVNSGIINNTDGGGTKPTLGGTNDAISTGGTRNTTINISLGKMMAAETMNFNGTTAENSREIERNFAEIMYRVLGIAETAS